MKARSKDERPSDTLLRRVDEAMAEQRLLAGVTGVVAAVSGGIDSVALLHLLHRLLSGSRIKLRAAHLNHGLRGPASDGDETFVRTLCDELGVSLHVEHAQLGRRPRPAGMSLEMMARDARLAFYRRVCRVAGREALATGHHADDVGETLLLRLARGAGMSGLSGLRPLRVWPDGFRIVRPLLGIQRGELRDWLQTRGLSWREDASNADESIPRNRLRHRLLPWLEANGLPDLGKSLARSAALLRDEDMLLDRLASRALDRSRNPSQGSGPGLSVPVLSRRPVAIQRRVLVQWMRSDLGIERPDTALVERLRVMLGAEHRDAVIEVEGRRQIIRCGDMLRVRSSRPSAGSFEVRLTVPGETVIGAEGLRVRTWLARGIRRQASTQPGRLPAEASLELAAWGERPLFMRSRKHGDRFAPSGMGGTRKVQDILVDAKVPAQIRDRIPLLVCDDLPVWIPGYRVARDWCVRDDQALALQIAVERFRTRP